MIFEVHLHLSCTVKAEISQLVGHSDLQKLRRYVAQTDEDVHTVHMRSNLHPYPENVIQATRRESNTSKISHSTV
jgi:hypothetical protein